MRSLLVQSSITSLNEEDGIFERRISAESVGCAMATQAIAEQSGCAVSREAFLAGMLCHIGKMVMLRRDRDIFREVVNRTRENPEDVCDVELGLFAFSHDQIGAALLEHWNFAPSSSRPPFTTTTSPRRKDCRRRSPPSPRRSTSPTASAAASA